MPSPSPEYGPQGSTDDFAECFSPRFGVPMEAFHQRLRQFHREYDLWFHCQNGNLELPRLLYVPMCLALGNLRRCAESPGRIRGRKPLPQQPKSKIEAFGMFRSGGSRHMS